jgi:hypothetical protein
MADDKTKRGYADNKRLNKGEPYEVAYARKKAKADSGVVSRRAAGKGAGAKRAGTRKRRRPWRGCTGRPEKDASGEGGGARRNPIRRAAKRRPRTHAPRTMKAADAVDLLTDDHLQLSALFKQYEKLARKKAPTDQRRALAARICDMLKAHTRIEEEILYPGGAQGTDRRLPARRGRHRTQRRPRT